MLRIIRHSRWMIASGSALLLILSLLIPYSFVQAESGQDVKSSEYLQAIVTGIDASSYVKGKDPTAYAPFRMIDGNEETSWQFSTKSSALKETYVYISFSGAIQVDQLWIKNGFWKYTNGYDQYTRNSRIKGMYVDFRYSGSSQYKDRLSFTLNDDTRRLDWQKLGLGRHDSVTGIRLRINSIYKGEKYATDVCVSEIMAVVENRGLSNPSLYTSLGSSSAPSGNTSSSGLYALAAMKLATRSGPGTEYTEMGTYSVEGQLIQILAKYYDINNVCWVKCKIPYHNRYITAWTGWKRFDPKSLEISLVPWAYAPFDIDGTLISGVSSDMKINGAETDSSGILTVDEYGMNSGGVIDNGSFPEEAGEEDEMISSETDSSNFTFGGGTLGEMERYTCSDPNGLLEILVRTEDTLQFQFSIERLAFFNDLYAELDEEGRGTFKSYGDWNISGSITLTGNLILMELDDNPNVYFDMSLHEFIGKKELVFLKDVLTVR